MIFRHRILLYNHCKSVNNSKYCNVELNFSLKNVHNTIQNVIYKVGYFCLSLPIISSILSIIQTFVLIILSYGEVPTHLSYIMDGNRRFAKSINQPLKNGHEIGSTSLLQIIHFAKTVGVKHLSVYAFSIENFNRSEKEVQLLMNLLVEKLTDLSQKIADRSNNKHEIFKGIQIKVVGDLSYLSTEVTSKINEIEKRTTISDPSNVFFNLYICCPYTSRNEIFHSIKANIKAKKQKEDTHDISESSLEKEMCLSKYIPTCDYLIRTSGATRFSDYLMWQSHIQCSFVFSETFWPDYGFRSFVKNMLSYSYFKSLYSWNKVEAFAHKKHSCLLASQLAKVETLKYSVIQSQIFEKKIFFPVKIISRALHRGRTNVMYEELKMAPKAVSIIERN